MIICSRKPSIVYIDKLEHNDKISGQYYLVDFIALEENLLKNKTKKLKEFIKEYNGGPMGFQLHTYDYTEYGVPVLRTKDMSEMSIRLEEPIFITEEKDDELKNSKTYPGDLVISKTGQIGVCSIVPSSIKNANLNQALCNIRLHDSKIDKYFLVVYLNSKYGQYQLIREGQGKAVQPGLTREEIYSIKIPSISMEIQKHIGDKVRRAEELREDAKRLKEEARVIVINKLQLNELQLKIKDNKKIFGWRNAEVLDTRIDSDYYSEKFILKEDHLKNYNCKFAMLNDLIKTIFTGKKLATDNEGEEVYYIQSGNISSNFLELDTKVKVNTNKLKLIEQGDILLAKDGATIGKLAVNYSNKKIILNEHTYCIRLKQKYKFYAAYIYYLLSQEVLNDLIGREGTGSAQQGLNQDFTSKIIIPLISEKEILKINELEEMRCKNIYYSKQLIQEAKQDVEDLIEGNFDMSKLSENTTKSR